MLIASKFCFPISNLFASVVCTDTEGDNLRDDVPQVFDNR